MIELGIIALAAPAVAAALGWGAILLHERSARKLQPALSSTPEEVVAPPADNDMAALSEQLDLSGHVKDTTTPHHVIFGDRKITKTSVGVHAAMQTLQNFIEINKLASQININAYEKLRESLGVMGSDHDDNSDGHSVESAAVSATPSTSPTSFERKSNA